MEGVKLKSMRQTSKGLEGRFHDSNIILTWVLEGENGENGAEKE